MANAASKDKVRADIAGPDYKSALDIIRNRIKAKKDHVSSTNGEISGLWDQIDKKGVNKNGAKLFLKLDGLEDAERRDVLRTIMKLGEAAGWNIEGDLIDKAEKGPAANIVQMPGKSARGKGAAAKAEPANESEAETVDPEAKIDPATFKASFVSHITDHSSMTEADAYVLAGTVFDSLTTEEKTHLCHRMAVEKAEAEMETWPDDGENADQ